MVRIGRTNRHCQPGDPEAPCDPTCSASFLDSFANDTFDQNLYWIAAAHGTTRSFPGRGCVDCSNTSFAEWRRLGFDRNSVVADPLFVDAAANDYRLSAGSPARALGIESIDVSRCGPQQPAGSDRAAASVSAPPASPATDGKVLSLHLLEPG